jgi:3D (Asp-Asp-Asp) domain-containing protein
MNLKRTALILLMVVSALPSAFGAYARDNSLLARVTVYWARGGHGSDRYTRQHKSATGLRLQQGHCAVDPRRIPYGSKVVLPDGTALSAVDTGTAVRNRKAARRSARTADERNAIVVDKFFETKRQALTWANSNPPFVNVKVLPPNAPAVSKPNITNSQPIALTPPAPPKTTSGGSTSAMTITNNASGTGPTGGIVRNPLGRLGR